MKTDLLERLKNITDLPLRHNMAREYLQFSMLEGLHLCGAFRHIDFVGGTCLRLIHGLARYSEDMDFSAANDGKSRMDLEKIANAMVSHLKTSGFEVSAGLKEKEGVNTALVKFPGLLHELGLAPTPEQKLLIKMEVDLRPPACGKAVKTIIREPALAAVSHYDLPSLMAGKLHALLARRYTKGRDWYDFLWYANKGVEPNIELLQNALRQRPSPHCSEASLWVAGLQSKLNEVNWKQAREDVAPFLQYSRELEFIVPETFIEVLGRMASGTRLRGQ